MGKTFRRADKFDRFGKLATKPRYGADDGFDDMSRSRIQDKLNDYTRIGTVEDYVDEDEIEDDFEDEFDDYGDDYPDEYIAK